MNRKYLLQNHHITLNPWQALEYAKAEYLGKFELTSNFFTKAKPFFSCILYLIINKDNSYYMDYVYKDGFHTQVIAKRPFGFVGKGEPVYNIDIREIINFEIPPYKNKYYFDFIIYILDISTMEYWATNFWTGKICTDLRYYLSKERKLKYEEIGKSIAEGYNRTFLLGAINKKTYKFRDMNIVINLINNGWIPTISLLPQPYISIIQAYSNSKDVEKVSNIVNEFFSRERLQILLNNWLLTFIVRGREEVLKTAINGIIECNYIAPIYILLPHIEGLITKHLRRKGITPPRRIDEKIRKFEELIVSEGYNTIFTHYLIKLFCSYLKKVFYRKWYPKKTRDKLNKGMRENPQRHPLAHGDIANDYFTRENCIKLISVIDNIILLSLLKKELPRIDIKR